MEVTITYKDSKQISEDSWRTFTKVIQIDENETIKEISERYFTPHESNIDVELHIYNR